MENVGREASTGAAAQAPVRAFDTRHLQNLAHRGFAGGADFEDAVRLLEQRAGEERRAQEAAEIARKAQLRRTNLIKRGLALLTLIAVVVAVYLLIP